MDGAQETFRAQAGLLRRSLLHAGLSLAASPLPGGLLVAWRLAARRRDRRRVARRRDPRSSSRSSGLQPRSTFRRASAWRCSPSRGPGCWAGSPPPGRRGAPGRPRRRAGGRRRLLRELLLWAVVVPVAWIPAPSSSPPSPPGGASSSSASPRCRSRCSWPPWGARAGRGPLRPGALARPPPLEAGRGPRLLPRDAARGRAPRPARGALRVALLLGLAPAGGLALHPVPAERRGARPLRGRARDPCCSPSRTTSRARRASGASSAGFWPAPAPSSASRSPPDVLDSGYP